MRNYTNDFFWYCSDRNQCYHKYYTLFVTKRSGHGVPRPMGYFDSSSHITSCISLAPSLNAYSNSSGATMQTRTSLPTPFSLKTRASSTVATPNASTTSHVAFATRKSPCPYASALTISRTLVPTSFFICARLSLMRSVSTKISIFIASPSICKSFLKTYAFSKYDRALCNVHNRAQSGL